MLGSATAALGSEARRHALIVALLVHLALGSRHRARVSRPSAQRSSAGSTTPSCGELTTSEGVDPSVVIVEYTEADEARYGYPLPDGTLAELLEKLAAARPLAIGLDLVRDRPEPQGGDPAGHERLSAVLAAHDFIIGIVKDTKPGAFGPPPALADQPRPARRRRCPQRSRRSRAPGAPLHVPARAPGRRWRCSWPHGGFGPTASMPAWQGDRLQLGATQYAPLHPQSSSLYAARRAGVLRRRLPVPPDLSRLPRHPPAPQRQGRARGRRRRSRDREPAGPDRQHGQAARDYFSVPVDCGGPSHREMFGVDLHAQVASQLIRQANGTSRPVETLDQRLGSPALGQAAGLAWTWLWCLLGGVTAAAAASPLVAACRRCRGRGERGRRGGFRGPARCRAVAAGRAAARRRGRRGEPRGRLPDDAGAGRARAAEETVRRRGVRTHRRLHPQARVARRHPS